MATLKKTRVFLFVMLLGMLVPATAHGAAYTVKSGDSLYTIGKLFNTTSANLMQSNGLKSDIIYPGQKLTVNAVSHTVKAGDTLYLVSKKYGVLLDAVRRASNEWDDLIYPGQELLIPGAVQSKASESAVISYTSADLDLLARLITAEADSEPYAAKVGVGAVVLNRVKDNRFPGTLSGVIYEKSNGFYQFTPVENGWINKTASADAKKAAYDALHGADPSKGAVFYFDDSATNSWLWSKPLAARIGKMVFVY